MLGSVSIDETYSDLDGLALDVHADLELKMLNKGGVDLQPVVPERSHSVWGDGDLALLDAVLGLC